MMLSVVLALILLLFGAGVLAWALVVSRRARLAMEGRMKLVGVRETNAPAAASGGLLKVRAGKFDLNVRKIFSLGKRRTWGMRVGALTLLLVAAVFGAATWALTYRFFDLSSLTSAALSVSAMYVAPRFVLSWQQTRVEREFMDLFPDVVDIIGRMLRAGLPVNHAVLYVAKEGIPPVSTVFASIADQLRIGVPLEEALDSNSRQIGLSDFRFFAVAVVLQYSTGGNLTSTLEIISDIIRRRRATRQKAKAATGEIRITAYTLGAIPFLTTSALLVTQPSYLTPMWADSRGHWILAMACACLFLAYLTMRTMMRSVTKV
jgi:tight adherence protein B